MSYFAKRTTRIVAGTLVGAMALSVSPILGFAGIASAADALPALAEPIGAGNFCENMPTTEPFTDVSATDPSLDEIICLVATNLTKGTTATTYSPNASITRRQMALFIKRLADLSNTHDTGTQVAALPAYDGVPDFTDIAAESTETKTAIGQLQQADIVNGTTVTTYSPGQNVSRRQMAAFVNRLELFLTGAAFTTTGDFFNDDTGDTGEANLNAVASVGIFQGDGAGNVDPGGALTRRQMANVLLRHAQVMFDAGDITRAFPATTNQTFTVTPAEAAVNTVSDNAAPTTANRGARTYTVSGLDSTKTFDIELHEAEDIVVTSGTVKFKNNVPVVLDGVSIETVNGANVGTADNAAATEVYEVHNVAPQSGTITFVVDSEVVDQVIPVINGDADADNTLDLTAGNTATNPTVPTEAFGIGGQKSWNPTEAATGATGTLDITTIDKTANYFVATSTFFYDANDVFQLRSPAGSGVCVNSTLATWEANLSVGDDLFTGSTYNADEAASSVLCLDDTSPASPGGVTATASGSTVTVGWNAVTSADSYNIYRAADPSTGNACPQDGGTADIAASAFALQGSVTSPTLSFVQSSVGDGTYCYFVTTVSGGDESAVDVTTAGSGSTAQVTTPVADVTAPTAVAFGSLVDTDTNFDNIADAGDVVVLNFSEVVNVASNAAIVITDTASDTGTITNGTNSTWTGSGTKKVTITLTQAIIENVSLDALNWAANVSNRSGITDTAGLAWNIGSGDVTLEDDGAEIISDTCDVGSSTCTIVFNEAVTAATANVVASYTYASAGDAETLSTAVLGADNVTVTLTFTGTTLDAGDSIDPGDNTAGTTDGVIDTDAQGAPIDAHVLA